MNLIVFTVILLTGMTTALEQDLVCPDRLEHDHAHMGYIIRDVDNLADVDEEGVTLIRRKLLEHGVIVVESQKLTRAEQVQLSNRLGEVVLLPPSLCSKDSEPGFPEIHRATNYWANGTWKGSQHCFGCYWHKDGNFQENGYIASMLYGEDVVANRSSTLFLDNCEVINRITPSTRELLSDTIFTVSVRNIPDFANGSEEDLALYPTVKRHNGIYRHPGNGRTCAYITNTLVTESERRREDMEAAWKDVIEGSTKYVHYWKPGDVVIWDNLAVMHRAGTRGVSGPGDRNPRMLYRTQTFLGPGVSAAPDLADLKSKIVRDM